MKTILAAILLLLTAIACQQAEPNQGLPASSRQFYQLQIYTFERAEQITQTDQYLQNALIPALERQEVGPVGVFKNRLSGEDTVAHTYVLIPLESLDQVQHIPLSLEQDSSYLSDGSDYFKAAYNAPPYLRFESILLHAFSEWPRLKEPDLTGPRMERIYELRSYESPTETYGANKIEMFNAGGEVKLFDRLGCNAVFYGQVFSGSRMPNLMYMTAYSDSTSRKEHWDAFFGSPEWKELIANPHYEHNVNHADIWLLYPTAYSGY
ncbi:MAG TPA: NIPSNAP family protein [Saprospiraceae bacterium]|nr:NIPSNAP family protein [Saprospiraceae bacterium]